MFATQYLLFRIYRRVVPEFLRRGRFGEFVESRAPHDFVYNPEYFRDVIENHSGAAAGPMAASIVRDLAPRSVIDVGCGGGNLLEALHARGCEVFGLEYAAAGVEACGRRGVPVRRFDLRRESFESKRRYDVVCSIEVAEHLPAQSADGYLRLLAGVGGSLVFSAATPGQGGTDHLNEQPHAYWIEKLSTHGLILDETISARWRDEWERAGLQPWFWSNIMVFRRDGGDGTSRAGSE